MVSQLAVDLGIVAFCLILLGITLFFVRTIKRKVIIVSKDWECTVEVQERTKIRMKERYLLEGAEVIKEEKQKYYKYNPLRSDMLNMPTFDEDEETIYTYNVYSWKTKDVFQTCGSSGLPFYADVKINDSEKLVKCVNYYFLVEMKKGDKKKYKVTEEMWYKYEFGDKVIIEIEDDEITNIEKYTPKQ